MTRTFIRWDDPSIESGAGPTEDDLINQVAKQIQTAQTCVWETHRHAFSGTHVKTQGIVKGTLTVLPDLESHLYQGLFSTPNSTFPIALRYSTETTDLIDDRVPQPRGIGIKVFNAKGPKLRQDGKDPQTQDFEFNSCAFLELGNARTCRDIIALRLLHGADGKGLDEDLRKREDYKVQNARNVAPNVHLVAQRQYSQAAIRYGDHVVKYRLLPTSDAQLALTNKTVTENDKGNTVLKDWLQEYFQSNEATYDFQVQFLENLDEQPIEDVRVEWDQQKYPFVTVAKVSLPAQESFPPKRVSFWEDHNRLDVWHGLQDHKPLGSINRLRKGVYKASAAFRRKMNGRQEVVVDDISQIPD
ncbi:hypothetical protein PHSY_004701 [Pseudozyma hubeiensis SY62]|uniref:Catalase core domain-containing protein n=1 Tax=Pseudozyma hubeiensis (strain SY62) TaxID=1305764 RepID=R9P787_PSEHS|nr:hypothetical protein PHSY_004701 [Pseudozyma hubeiensis SY62]GAC97117.1 hypothetical protein PHSY_004701 [Pseudozyma hubeiensis SY62]